MTSGAFHSAASLLRDAHCSMSASSIGSRGCCPASGTCEATSTAGSALEVCF